MTHLRAFIPLLLLASPVTATDPADLTLPGRRQPIRADWIADAVFGDRRSPTEQAGPDTAAIRERLRALNVTGRAGHGRGASLVVEGLLVRVGTRLSLPPELPEVRLAAVRTGHWVASVESQDSPPWEVEIPLKLTTR